MAVADAESAGSNLVKLVFIELLKGRFLAGLTTLILSEIVLKCMQDRAKCPAVYICQF